MYDASSRAGTIMNIPANKVGSPISTVFEGSYYETENDYMVLVYYRGPGDRYDRLITTEPTHSTIYLLMFNMCIDPMASAGTAGAGEGNNVRMFHLMSGE